MYEPILNKNNYQYIVEQIKQMILNGELVIGDRLPSERDLAEMYQVSRASVREALKALEAFGLLECHQGGGNYIVNNLKEQMTDNLSLVFLLDHCKLEDLTQLRYAFETETLRSIIEKDDPVVFQQFRQLAQQIEDAPSVEEIKKLDLQFHTMVASLAVNPLLHYLQASIHTVYIKSIAFLNARYPYWDDVSLKVSKEYQVEILNALFTRDMHKVRKALFHHYHNYSDTDINALYEDYLHSKDLEKMI